ncbi:MAG: hypothetical protein HYV27_09765 [Candidatus Hydrogenedentes bacterium]|nr:hypothetical protein [Candidatus Hydrogenedentota bacterium]
MRTKQRSLATLPLLILMIGGMPLAAALDGDIVTTEAVAREIERVLPVEAPYAYHERLSSEPVHRHRRDPGAARQTDELELPAQGWALVHVSGASAVLEGAARDFQDYLQTSMGVQVALETRDSLAGWKELKQTIVADTREQLAGCGAALKASKDYEILVTPEQIVVCGFDEKGVQHGLYHLEARMNLREAPMLPADLHTVRHSLYDTRMVQSWMGWMEFPDTLLSHLAHDGFDAIYASVYTNPNGDRSTIRDQGLHADHLSVCGDSRERGGSAAPGARLVAGLSGYRGLCTAHGGVLVQSLGRRPRREQGIH